MYPRRLALAPLSLSSVASLALVALFALPASCSSSDSGTGGKRVTLTAAVVGSPGTTSSFETAAGWTVTLSKAVLATGPLYYYDGATIFSGASEAPAPWSPLDDLRRALSIKAAHAHPGHYVPGNARGQLLISSSVDLRSGAVLGEGEGVTGIVRSATFSFGSPASGPFAGELGAHVAVLEGRATKGSEERVFRAEIDAADLTNEEGALAVEGCPFEETSITSDGTVTVTVAVEPWFDQVEFDSLPESSDGAPVVMPASAIGRRELVRGMKAGVGYTFAYHAR